MTRGITLSELGFGTRTFKGSSAKDDAWDFIYSRRSRGQQWTITSDEKGRVIVERDYSVL